MPSQHLLHLRNLFSRLICCVVACLWPGAAGAGTEELLRALHAIDVKNVRQFRQAVAAPHTDGTNLGSSSGSSAKSHAMNRSHDYLGGAVQADA
jgi:hypothetical protein